MNVRKIAVAAGLIIATHANAEAVFLLANGEGTESFYGYSETLTKVSDGYSLLIGKRFPKNPSRNEERMFIGITFDHCNSKFGSLMSRVNQHDSWQVISNVSFEKTTTVGDALASQLCEAGKMVFSKKSTSKTTAF